jgi:hypothetical protein
MAADWARGGIGLGEMGGRWLRTGRGLAQDRTCLELSPAAVRFGLFSLYRYFTRGFLGNVQAAREGLSANSIFMVQTSQQYRHGSIESQLHIFISTRINYFYAIQADKLCHVAFQTN